MIGEERFIFFPDRLLIGDPSHFGLDFEDLWVTASDGVRLHAWFVRAKGDERARMLFLHGNAGNISHRLENAYLLCREGISVFMLEYRGYGKSEGKPGEQGLYLDAEAGLLHLVQDLGTPAEQVVVFGRSLGGAVAVDLASKNRIGALILESTFTSVTDLASVFFPFLPMGHILKTRFASIEKIADVHAPKLHLHGTADDLIHYENGKRLFEAAPEPKRFYPIEGAGHNDTYVIGARAYLDELTGFIRETIPIT